MLRISPSAEEFVRFVFAGLFNTGITYVLYLMLLPITNYILAYSAAYIVGIFISYLLSSFFVFKAAPCKKTAFHFPLIYAFQYACGSSLLWLLVHAFGIGEKVAMAIVILSNTMITFALLRTLFKTKHP